MGFDNECILNIQSLAGEYFCPVCRLLVYPHEALQSQCTHLYCKPCLTYVVSTTRACPYDGYLVTEADSKPLVESNKALAETIGKIGVHCLYHRSGCTWQGPLSDCITHCSGCAFGNSPVLCNRCGIQLVHRQVQEHAQTCPGVHPQTQQVDGAESTTAAVTDQTQSAALSGIVKSQGQSTQSVAITAPGQDPNQQTNVSSQGLAVVQAAVPTSEQWYQQQQQQYQQYYQQYPGYDPYQQQYQQYYPYQQQAGVQYQQPQLSQAPSHVASQQQPQVYMQSQPQSQQQVIVQPQPQPLPQPTQPLPQPQPPTQSYGQTQSHMHVQTPAVGQTQNQGLVNPPQPQQHYVAAPPHAQIQPQSHTPAHGQPQSQPQPQPQPQSYPQVQPNSQQLVHMPPYQQPHSQMPHSQAQIQQHAHPQFQSQHLPVSQPPTHPKAPAQPHSQLPNPQSNQSLSVTPNAQPQTQYPPTYPTTGYHSYSQPQHHQQMPSGAAQNGLPTQPQGGAHPLHQPVQMQAQLPQPPLMRPPAAYHNQSQPQILPSPGQVQNISSGKKVHAPSQAQQTGGLVQSVSQRPLMQQPASQQAVHHQQHFGQQGQFVQHRLPMASQLRPQGPPNSLSQHNHGSVSLQQNISVPHGMQHNQSQNSEGRSFLPNYGVQNIPYSQSMAGVQARPLHPGVNQPTTKQGNAFGNNNQVQFPGGFGEHKLENTREFGSSSQQDAKRAPNHLDVSSNSRADASKLNTEAFEANLKVSDDGGRSTTGDKSIQVDASQVRCVDSDLPVSGGALTKQVDVKVDVAENTLDHSNNDKLPEVNILNEKDVISEPNKIGDSVIEKKGTQEGSEQKILSSQNTEGSEEQNKGMQIDGSGILHPSGTDEVPQVVTTTSAIHASPENGKSKLLHQHGYQDKNHSQSEGTLGATDATQPSHQASMVDHTRHQMSGHGKSTFQQGALLQVPPPGSFHHAQVPNNSVMQIRPRANPSEQFLPGGIPEPGASSFGRGLGQNGPQQMVEFQSIPPQGHYGQGQPPGSQGLSRISLGDPDGRHFHVKLPGAFDSRGLSHGPEAQFGVQQPGHPMEADIFPNQRLKANLHVPGSMEHRSLHLPPPNMLPLNGATAPDSSSKLGLRDERLKFVADEKLNLFPLDSARRSINQTESEDILRQFPRPSHMDTDLALGIGNYSLRSFDRGVHGKNFDSALNIDGAGASRFLPPRHMDGSLHLADAERPIGLFDDSVGQLDLARGHSDFRGPGNYGRHFDDGFGPRSPLREYHGRHGFGGRPGFPGADEIDGQDFPRHLGDPLSLHESRFPIFRSHMQRGEFDGPGNFMMGEPNRNGDLIGQDRRFGPGSIPGHLRLGEATGFGSHPGQSRFGEMSMPGNFEPYSGVHRQNHPRLGEPGFRSSFSRQGLGDEGRFYTGDVESFDNLRKRKTTSMGWCRICKVDCETVEGLDLHSQTREHQKMAMDMVQSIKQNVKKQKANLSDHASLEDANKSKNAGLESRGKKQ